MSINNPIYRPQKSYQLALTTTSANTSGTGGVTNGTTVLRFNSTVAAYVAIGGNSSSPLTANTTTSMLLTANQPEYFRCYPGDCISGIVSTGTGTLNITELGL